MFSEASYRGFTTMINGVCFCGWAYSFAGDVSSCPQCGEHVSFARGLEAQHRQETIARIVARASVGSPSEDLAA
jgi:hypothetical protein